MNGDYCGDLVEMSCLTSVLTTVTLWFVMTVLSLVNGLASAQGRLPGFAHFAECGADR